MANDSKEIVVLLCFDKFKGTLSNAGCHAAVRLGLDQVFGREASEGRITYEEKPLSDGGDGFVQSLRDPLALDLGTVHVTGPLPDHPVEVQYGTAPATDRFKKLAVLEMALASGLALVSEADRDPAHTTTAGTGEMILHAYRAGCRRFLLGVGGSATNEGGAGVLQALGLNIYVSGEQGEELLTRPLTGADLICITRLEKPQPADALLPDATMEVGCDVDNPFVGPRGAVAVYSPQKGAKTSAQRGMSMRTIDALEAGMKHLAEVYERDFGVKVADMPGAGAAGGMAGGLAAGLGATFRPGVDIVADVLELDEAIARADLVVTGEGSYDAQTDMGKVVSSVRARADRLGKPCVVLCGQKEAGMDEARSRLVFAMTDRFPLDRCMTQTAVCLQELTAGLKDEIRQLVQQ